MANAAQNFLVDSATIKGGAQLIQGANYSTLQGWLEGGVGAIGIAAATADAGLNFATGGVKGAGKAAVKGVTTKAKKIFVIGEAVGTNRVKEEALKIGGKFYEARKTFRQTGLTKALRNNYQALHRRFLQGYKLKDLGLHPKPGLKGKGAFYPWEQKWKELWGWE